MHAFFFFRQIIAVIICLAIATGGSTAFAQESTVARGRLAFVSFGFGPCSTYESGTVPDSNSPSGRSLTVSNFQLIRKSDMINAGLGAQFGMEYQLIAPDNTARHFTKVWIFPEEMKDPKSGKAFKEMRREIYITPNERDFTMYKLEEPFEIKKGTWELRFYYQLQLVYQKIFELY